MFFVEGFALKTQCFEGTCMVGTDHAGEASDKKIGAGGPLLPLG
jgi:hypothetical protein